METEDAEIARRRGVHEVLAARLSALSDERLAALVSAGAGSWRASVHGSQSGIIDIDGMKIFVKKISLTDLERSAANEGSTANLFDLPLFYQYGVGSAGFGAWRELSACLRASDWALSGECHQFPLVHHWRVLPRAPLGLSPKQQAWLDGAPDYWDRSEAIQGRLNAISKATASVVLFLECMPVALRGWLEASPLSAEPHAALEAAILRIHDQWRAVAAFMNTRGMLHFDLNASNVLTDGGRIYAADFGLAICEDFDLSPAERAFFESHRRYDEAYVSWAFLEWLREKTARDLTPALRGLVGRCAPVAKVFGAFISTLAEGSKTTPYPEGAIAAALKASSYAP